DPTSRKPSRSGRASINRSMHLLRRCGNRGAAALAFFLPAACWLPPEPASPVRASLPPPAVAHSRAEDCGRPSAAITLAISTRSSFKGALREPNEATWVSESHRFRAMPGRRTRHRANRPEATRADNPHGLIVSKLDRLSRSVSDFADILARFQRQGWALVVMDLGVDTSTIMGAAMAQMVSVFS